MRVERCGRVGLCMWLAFLLGGVCVGFGAELFGRIVGVPVGAGCAPLVAGLFLFCCVWERGRGLRGVPFRWGPRSGVVGTFGSASGCLGGLLGVSSACFGGLVSRVSPRGFGWVGLVLLMPRLAFVCCGWVCFLRNL